MEEKDKIEKEKANAPPDISKPTNSEKPELSNQNIYEHYQKESTQINLGPEKGGQNKNQQKSSQENEQSISNNNNINNSNEKTKRHRRRKDEINERNFKCPDCEKCYSSGPALTNHRKTKHGYGNNGEKKNRGRPKRDEQNENAQISPISKFNNFFLDENRRPTSSGQSTEDKIITLDIVKAFSEKIFNQCKDEIFQDLAEINQYSFYKLIIDNWDKENPFPSKECYSDPKLSDKPTKIQTYSLDELFFLYLKEFANKTNKDYFWFMLKFTILFRECINTLRNNLVKQEHQSENKKFYSEIYNAETVPDICNDFFVDFMEPKNFYGLHKEELIELIQHFCYWLYSNEYTQSHLTLLDN